MSRTKAAKTSARAKQQQPAKKRQTQQRRRARRPRVGQKLDALTYAPMLTGQAIHSSGPGWASVESKEVAMEIRANFNTSGVAAAKGYLRQLAFSNEAADSTTAGRANNINRTFWLGRQAQLYDKFKIDWFQLSFYSTRSKVTSGGIALRFDSDPNNNTADASAKAMISGNMNAQLAAVHQQIDPFMLKTNQLNRLPQYDISHKSADQNLEDSAIVGTIRFAHDEIDLGRAITAAADFTIGYIIMSYKVTFYNQSANPA